MIVYIGHIISILIFAAVTFSAGYIALTIKHSTLPTCYLWVPRLVVGILMLQSTIFLLMQAEHILGYHGILDSYDPGTRTRVWYDILAGMSLAAFATAMNIFFKWKRSELVCPPNCPMRRKSDKLYKTTTPSL